MVHSGGMTNSYTYDNDRLTMITKGGSSSTRYDYSNSGGISKVTNAESGRSTQFGSDASGRLTSINRFNTANGGDPENVSLSYGRLGELTGLSAVNQGGVLSKAEYAYDSDHRPVETILSSMNGKIDYIYTGLDRVSGATHTFGSNSMATTYHYISNGSNATSFVDRMTNNLNVNGVPGAGFEYDYTYKTGSSNIQTITENGVLQHTYSYDALNQLTHDIDATGKITEYTYNTAGNLLRVKEDGVITETYTYGDSDWKDKLTNFNGTEITYGAGGNPIEYDGYTLEWQKGRQLARIFGNSIDISFGYDYNGLRTRKGNTEFLWAGWLLMSQSDGTDTLNWTYDVGGTAVGFKYNGTNYYYIRNLQGDVVAIYNASGSVVAKYDYDAWGVCTVTQNVGGIADVNPIRYRGYYFDVETGLYYLQSRYYNPEWRRFINADSFFDTGAGVLGTNMYAYCLNNPVNLCDPSGLAPSWATGGLLSMYQVLEDMSYPLLSLLNAGNISSHFNAVFNAIGFFNEIGFGGYGNPTTESGIISMFTGMAKSLYQMASLVIDNVSGINDILDAFSFFTADRIGNLFTGAIWEEINKAHSTDRWNQIGATLFYIGGVGAIIGTTLVAPVVSIPAIIGAGLTGWGSAIALGITSRDMNEWMSLWGLKELLGY